MNNLSSLQKKDLKYIFHPCSQMKDYEELPPIIIKKAEGIDVYKRQVALKVAVFAAGGAKDFCIGHSDGWLFRHD